MLDNETVELISFSALLREANLPWSKHTLDLIIAAGIEPKGRFGRIKLYDAADVDRIKNADLSISPETAEAWAAEVCRKRSAAETANDKQEVR